MCFSLFQAFILTSEQASTWSMFSQRTIKHKQINEQYMKEKNVE